MIVEKAGVLNGFIVWLHLEIDSNNVLDVLEDQASWLPVYFPVSVQGISLNAGDKIRAQVTRCLSSNGLNPDFFIKGDILTKIGIQIPFDITSLHQGNIFQGSEFYKRLFPEGRFEVFPGLSVSEIRTYLSEVLPEYMVPAAYVRLDVLPLTPNGKLDRKALPAPEGDAYSRGVYQAPIGPIETALAEIWSEVLGVERVGRQDSFFELGGHSLLAVKMLQRIKNSFAKEVPLQTIFELSTLAALAAHIMLEMPFSAMIHASEYSANSPLVLIKRGTGEPPLFLFHPMGGGLAGYRELVSQLSKDITIYGLHAYSDKLENAFTIPQISSIYAKYITAIQPHGPYRLLGYSLGGLIATEVARELQGANAFVDLLALIDATVLAEDFTNNPTSSSGANWRNFLNLMFPALGQEHHSRIEDGQLSALLGILQGTKSYASYTLKELELSYSTFRRHNLAVCAYNHSPYSEKSVHYRGTRGGPTHDVGREINRLHKFWTNGEIIQVDSDHLAMMAGKSAALIALDLNQRLFGRR